MLAPAQWRPRLNVRGLTSGRSAAMKAIGRHRGWAAFGIYLVLSLALWHQVVLHPASKCLCVGTSDETQFMWAMVWWPHALLHGINPFITHVLWTPGGLDLARSTSVPGAALVTAPITALAGPIVSYNILSFLGPLLGAWFAYRLCAYLASWPAALLGGYLFGFSSYELGQLIGHLNLFLVFAIPLAALLTLQRLDGVISGLRYLVLMALTVIVQLLLSTEILWTLTVVLVLSLGVGWCLGTAAVRRHIVGLLPQLGAAYLVMAAVCAPYLYYALFRGHAYAAAWNQLFPADSLNFLVPTAVTYLGGHRFASVSGTFISGLVESGAYLGIPLVVIVIVFLVREWSTRTAKFLAVVLACCVLWALGGHLWFAGHRILWLPDSLLGKLPLFSQVLPVRVAVYVSLGCAVIAAMWLSRTGSGGLRRWLLALIAVAFIFPDVGAAAPGTRTPLFHASISVPRFFTSDLYRRYLHRNEVVMPLPYGQNGLSMLWQASTGMYFKMASGYFGTPPADYLADPLVPQLLANAPGPQAASQLTRFIRERDVGAVIADPSALAIWLPVLKAAGLKQVSTGGVDIFRMSTGGSGSPAAHGVP